MSDIQLIFHNIFDPIVRFFTGNRPPIQTHYTIPEVPITPSPESIDLMNTLAHVDITGIHAVKFTTKKGSQFQIGTENMKRLAKYISTTMGKTEFIAHELDTVFSYVTKNLYSKIP